MAMHDSMGNTFYCVIRNTDSKDRFPDNTQTSFRVKLDPPVTLLGKWGCGLTEITYNKQTFSSANGVASLYICSSMCDASHVGDKRLPLLRQVPIVRDGESDWVTERFHPVYTVPVKQGILDNIDVTILDECGKPIVAEHDQSTITLTIEFLPLPEK